MTASTVILDPNAIYYAAPDRWVCASLRCAGVTAATTGRTRGGLELHRVTAQDVRSWQWWCLGDLTCECGRFTATLDGDDTLAIVETTAAA